MSNNNNERRKNIIGREEDEEVVEHHQITHSLTNAIDKFQQLCQNLSKEELILFQTSCNLYLQQLTQEEKQQSSHHHHHHSNNCCDHHHHSEDEADDHEHDEEEEDESEEEEEKVISSNLKKIEQIKRRLRSKLPNVTSLAPNEKFYFPGEVDQQLQNKNIERQFEGYYDYNTLHVDAFIYDDEEMEDLYLQGKIKRFYCDKCKSNEFIKDVNVISHSFSLNELAFIFSRHCLNKDFWISKSVLERIKKSKGITSNEKIDNSSLLTRKNVSENGIVLMDVGSRLGSVLYYAYLFCDQYSLKQLIGVEINDYFVQIQKDIVKEFKMEDRISICHQDVLKSKDLIDKCDVLVMHNVFEWFCSLEDNQKVWKTLREELITKKGTRLITCPSIQQSLTDAGLDNVLSIDGWLKEIPLVYPKDEDGNLECQEIHLYEVI
ncbi:hypothetical protein ABK040_007501 [Willaertia magna]